MVSFQLESDAEVRSPRFTCGIKVARAMDRADSSLVSLLFGNHFVVELLWPSRERRARMITMVEFKIFNLLSMNSNTRIRCRGTSSFQLWNRNLLAIWSSRILDILNLLSNIENGKTKLWYDFVISSLVFHKKRLSKKDIRNQNQMQRLMAILV